MKDTGITVVSTLFSYIELTLILAGSLKADGQSVDAKTVESYLRYLTGSFVPYQANRFDIKGKQQLDSPRRKILSGKRRVAEYSAGKKRVSVYRACT